MQDCLSQIKNGRFFCETIYLSPQSYKIGSNKISTLVSQYKIDAITIGDGTAGRETGTLSNDCVLIAKIQVFMVNEMGLLFTLPQQKHAKSFGI